MKRFGQVGIAIGALGIIVAMMGLYPGLTGVEPTVGIGIVQVFLLLFGYTLLLFGAWVYARFTFYFGIEPTLMQQIGIRLVMTGILFGALAGLSDILGFGSHLRTLESDIFFGPLQAFGILTSLGVSSFGILVYVVSGKLAPDTDDAMTSDDAMTDHELDDHATTPESSLESSI